MAELTDQDYAIEARRYAAMADAALQRRQYALVARYTQLAQELTRNAMRARRASSLVVCMSPTHG